ncbi:MAG TPA: glycosyltransferase family 8 protein [Devosia sp.]|nr:glycosyltransferase family 8 protein [Devosia sp.]
MKASTDGPSLHIALTFDDGFWAPAYATMRSVCLASRRRGDLVFHLFHRGLSPAHRATLDAIGTEFGAQLVDYDLSANAAFNGFLAGMSYHKALTNLVYARLMLDQLMPAGISRILYLDCDMLVRAPVEELFALDLEGKAVAAVLDPHRHRAMLGCDFRQNSDLFSFDMPYFNAGMLVIDRAAFAAADLPGRTRAYHEAGVLARTQYDQAVLNLVFKDNWLPLDFRWNLINPQPAHENFEPKIVHYTGPNKPWQLFSRVAFAQAYRHTMTNEVFYRYIRERRLRRLKRLVGR